MIGSFKIVDGHTHTFSSYDAAEKILESFNKIYNINFDNPGIGTIDDVLGSMEKSQIDFTIMANFAPTKILHSNNQWTIEISKIHNSLIPLVSFDPDMEGNLGKLLEGYLIDGAKGIKIHPMAQAFDPDNNRMHEIYSYCDDIRLPVVFHCGRVANARLNEFANLHKIMPVINKYRRMPIILTHMVDGNVQDVFHLASNYPNVYFDTSIVITGFPPIKETNEPSWLDDELVEDVINKVGADRVIFGSDYPWGSPGYDINRLLNLNLSDSQKSLILGENAIKIFRI
jgi:predicted TIM-barrel fold metal-dependent hydrolase